MNDITKAVLNFSNFLNSNWVSLIEFLSHNHIDEDKRTQHLEVFIQANWEILVEMVVCKKGDALEYYSSGADLFNSYYRVIDPEKEATFKVVVFSEGDQKDELNLEWYKLDSWEFMKFVSFRNGNYYDAPPFNHVLVDDENGRPHIFSKNNLIFQLLKV